MVQTWYFHLPIMHYANIFSIVQVRFVKRMFLMLNGDSFFMIKTDKKTDQTILTTLYFHLTEIKNKNKTKITKKLD